MKRFLPVFGLLFFFWSCAALPPIEPASAPGAISCDRFFVHGSWQFVHRLTVGGPGGKSLSLLGVTVVASRAKTLKTALMTPEGMVLFEAESAPALTVHRSVPPFDREGFARGLMADVRMIFFAPQGPAEQGTFQDGSIVCRYRRRAGGWLDAVWHENGARRIVGYDESGRRVREVALQRGAPAGGTMVLTASGDADYRIEMEAVEAVRVGE